MNFTITSQPSTTSKDNGERVCSGSASLNPGEWTKDPSPEDQLKTFDKYIVRYQRWMTVCRMNLQPNEKWELLLATGGDDMEDLVLHRAGVEVRHIQAVQAVQGQPAGSGGNPAAVLAVA